VLLQTGLTRRHVPPQIGLTRSHMLARCCLRSLQIRLELLDLSARRVLARGSAVMCKGLGELCAPRLLPDSDCCNNTVIKASL
jgi:hypothetical protein